MDNKLLEQRARAFDYLFDAVVVTDMTGTIIDWNPGSERLYGYTRDEAIGRPVNILHVPEDTEHITAEVLNAVDKKGQWSGEIRMLHKDGSIGWIESMVVPLFDDAGAMIGALGINRDISERKQHQERLAYQAHHDPLTGLPNRYLLVDRLEQLISVGDRSKQTFALLFIDVDNLKRINDKLGHAAGDKVLEYAALIFKQNVRTSDTVARFGGDEFVILLQGIHQPEEISRVIEAISDGLSRPLTLDDNEITPSASIGTAIYPVHGDTADKLMSHADRVMYQVKRSSPKK